MSINPGRIPVEIQGVNAIEAIKTGKIKEFVKQEERRGIGPTDRAKLDAAIKKMATTPQQSLAASSSCAWARPSWD